MKIIFLHKGDAPYLQYTLPQAVKSNPNTPVILLGDASNKKYADATQGVTFYPYEDYKTEAQGVLVKHYKHMSTNPAHYELICIARWFIICEFMEKENITNCFITDSDVLLYCDLGEELRKYWSLYRCTLTHNTSAGISFMNDRELLRKHCDFVIDCYTQKPSVKHWYDKAVAHYEVLQKNGRPGGVCDMTWWGFFRHFMPPGDFGETMSITSGRIDRPHEDGAATFDHNINVSYGYEMENGIKKFTFRDGIPYSSHERYGEVKFNCIHFQGGAKRYIREFYERS